MITDFWLHYSITLELTVIAIGCDMNNNRRNTNKNTRIAWLLLTPRFSYREFNNDQIFGISLTASKKVKNESVDFLSCSCWIQKLTGKSNSYAYHLNWGFGLFLFAMLTSIHSAQNVSRYSTS